MAGVLPGVKCARRRRFHQSGGWLDWPTSSAHGLTRKSTFCLYNTTNHESFLSSTSSLLRRNMGNTQPYQHEILEDVAREAKERLHEKLMRAQRRLQPKRSNTQERLKGLESRSIVPWNLQTEVFGSKKIGSKRFSWARFVWKSSDQEDCAVCLEQFKTGETLVNLPCAHRFHSKCLLPWLEANANCPFCRMGILR